MERVGDHTKNMANLTLRVLQLPNIDNASSSLRRWSREVRLMLKDSLEAYFQRDPEVAKDVISRDIDVDELYNGLFRQFVTHMMEDPRNITACLHLHFIAKNIERMGDHVTSIAEQVVLVVTGQMPSESRTKGDRTSIDVTLSQD